MSIASRSEFAAAIHSYQNLYQDTQSLSEINVERYVDISSRSSRPGQVQFECKYDKYCLHPHLPDPRMIFISNYSRRQIPTE